MVKTVEDDLAMEDFTVAIFRYKTIQTVCIKNRVFFSQRRNILLFYTSNMAAVTSQENPLFTSVAEELNSELQDKLQLKVRGKLVPNVLCTQPF